MIILAYILSSLALLMSIMFLIKLKSPIGWIVFLPKLTAGALSLGWAIMGTVGAVIGWAYQALWAIPLGIVGAAMMTWYFWRVTRNYDSFEDAFGTDWSDLMKPEQARRMVQQR